MTACYDVGMAKTRDGRGHPIEEEAEYFVQDKRQYVGNSVLWWGVDGGGYTCDLNKAGRYTGNRVRSMRDTDVPWPVKYILERASLHVDAQHL